MAANYVELQDAAKLLGISADQLNEMREAAEIHGYRDGTSWKFKQEEIDRVLSERDAGDADDDFLDLDDDGGKESSSHESILVSESILGQSQESTSSTIIGAKSNNADDQRAADSDLNLTPEVGSSDLDIGSDDAESDLALIADEPKGASPGDSDVRLVPSNESGIDSDDVLAGSNLDLGVGSGTGDLEVASDLSLGSDDLAMGSDELNAGDDDLALSEDDDDLVLGGSSGSGIGSDLALVGDSGINLASPSDSGLSLEEEPLDLSGGSSGGGLELPEDDDDIVALEDESGEAAQMKQDEEFLLSPSDDVTDDGDSGSQVIALDDSAAFQPADGQQALLAEDPAAQQPGLAAIGGGAPATMPAPSAPTVPEAPYSLLNVLSLMTIMLIMIVSSILSMDLVRNIWAFDQDANLSSSLMDAIINMLGMN